jgi:hypothetical protein
MAWVGHRIEDRLFSAPILRSGALLVVTGYEGYLVLLFVFLGWLGSATKGAALIDFLVFWSAGSLALQDHAAAAYDLATMSAVELRLAASDYPTLPWVYPPTFLLAVTPFALLPYAAGYLTWIAAGLMTYAGSLFAVIPRRLTSLVALASPAVLCNLFEGQNGLFTTALLGGSLAFLETRPVLAGIFLGLLTYNPQIGVLFPIVLLITGRWRVIASAAATAVCFAGASYLAFGTETWARFLASLTATADAEFTARLFPFVALQSTYGLFRSIGSSEAMAWAMQGIASISAGVAVCWIWTRPLPFDLKAAAISAGALIITPYLLPHDLAALAVPMAFLIRHGLSSGFLSGERTLFTLIAFSQITPFIYGERLPLGPLLVALLFLPIMVRVRRVRIAEGWT